MVRYKGILEQYFVELKDFYKFNSSTGLATAELSFRPFLDNFFANLCSYFGSNIQRIFEPRNQGKYGRPDWAFTDSNTMGVYGYVEAKGLSPEENINVEEYKSQVEKYLNLGNPVLLTDGIEFVYYDVDGSADSFELFQKPVNWEEPEYNLQTLERFQKFFSKIGFRTIPEQMVITELSTRAKLLCTDLLELLNLEEDEAESKSELTTIRTLKRLWDIAANNLDASLSDDRTFAGFISQILAFGLLYAHRFINDEKFSPSLKYEMLHYFWTQKPYKEYSDHVEPFVHLFNALSEELDSKLSKIGGWYDNTRRFLAFVKLSHNAVRRPNFHQLYEEFLSAYDRDTRIDFGAWYTPVVLADFIARLVFFNIQVNPDLKILQNNPFFVIDPCCGTGTFLESVLDNITLPPQSKLIGFEILPVPYALANYRLSIYEIPTALTLSVHLTNTLGDNTFCKPEYDFSKLDSVGLFFAKEQVASYKLSQPPLTIIIGNPPCSDSSVTNAGQFLESLMNDFRPPIRRGRQNVQMQLTNEWIKFLRWGIYKAMISKPSIIAFILPSAFAENISFKYARKFLIENANEISVIEFDSDNRVESANQNVFNTLQGRLLILASFTADNTSKFVRYKDLRGLSKAQKLEFFSKDVTALDWDVLSIDEEYSLRPKGEYDVELYSQFIPLAAEHGSENGIFLRHCSGMKLAPTHLLVHFSKGQLSRRSKYIGDLAHSYSDIKDRWYSGQAKPPAEKKLSNSVRVLVARSSKNGSQYSYRPFLEAYVNDDETLLTALKNAEGGGMRYRPEVRAAFSDPNVFGFAVAPAPAEISRTITKFTSFCWHLPDNDLATRGNAHVFCNRFPNYKKGSNWNSDAVSNINPKLLEILSEKVGLESAKVQDTLVFYAYAVLSSPYFLNEFSAKLHSLAGQTPAIPITNDKKLYLELVKIGKRLAALERSDYKFSQQEADGNFTWMNPLASFELKGYSINEDGVEFTSVKGNHFIQPVPSEILEFSVSGYGIVREWLKYHSYSYYRKALAAEEIDDFMNLVNRLRIYIAEHKNLDTVVRDVMASNLIQLNS